MGTCNGLGLGGDRENRRVYARDYGSESEREYGRLVGAAAGGLLLLVPVVLGRRRQRVAAAVLRLQSVNELNARNAKMRAHLVLVGDPRRRIVKVARRRVDAAAVRLEAAEMLVV